MTSETPIDRTASPQVLPFNLSASTSRSFATISSGLRLFLAIHRCSSGSNPRLREERPADRLPAPPDELPCAFSVSLKVAGALIFLNRHYGNTSIRPGFAAWLRIPAEEGAESRSGSVYRLLRRLD